MRIIAGELGGRLFKSPHAAATHPMSDKIRGALFAILGDIEGLTVLDAFAGSGALSLEAISRGATRATVIECDRAAQAVIADNIRMLNLDTQLKLIRSTANAWLATHDQAAVFDLVLCDPPYGNLQLTLVQRLAVTVRSGGLLVLSCPADMGAPVFDGLLQIERRQYGDAQLCFYRR